MVASLPSIERLLEANSAFSFYTRDILVHMHISIRVLGSELVLTLKPSVSPFPRPTCKPSSLLRSR